MVKIHIIGGPGSGKTYVSKKLSELLKIECFDLDDLYWDHKANTYGKKESERIRDKKLKAILKKKSWIIEGVYFEWLLSSFSDAGLIIVLTPNVLIREFRIIRRFVKRKLGLIKTKHESIKEFIKLLKWNHQFDANNLIRLKKFINKFDKKTIYFKKSDQAIKYVLNKTSKASSE